MDRYDSYDSYPWRYTRVPSTRTILCATADTYRLFTPWIVAKFATASTVTTAQLW